MFTVGIDFTNMELCQPITIGLQHRIRFRHSRVNLPGMPDIKTELCLGKAIEKTFEFTLGPSDGFSVIHIFDTNKIAEFAPEAKI